MRRTHTDGWIGRFHALTIAIASIGPQAAGVSWGAQAARPEASAAARIQASRDRLLKVPGGFTIRFSMTVLQDEKAGSFLWRTGSRGEIKVLWPRIYSKFDGFSRDDPARTVTSKEGEYNFESMIGAGRADQFVQIVPYRHGWSSVHLFPLMYQYFDEADQYYTPGHHRPTDYWLPGALADHPYDRAADELVEGLNCQVWAGRDGRDKIWVCEPRGDVIVQRELYDKASRVPIERMTAKRATEVRPGIWFPFELTFQKYSLTGLLRDEVRLNHTVKLAIDRFRFGDIQEGSLHISIPKGAQVDDQIRNISYQKSSPDIMFFASLQGAKARLARPSPIGGTPRISPTLAALCVATVANLAIFAVRWQTRKR